MMRLFSSYETQLANAIKDENIPRINELIGKVDINKKIDNITPLGLAIKTKNIIIIGKIINAGADINTSISDNISALTYAIVVRSDNELIKYLLEKGANVNIYSKIYINKDEYYIAPPLFFAINKRNKELIEKLIEYGAEVNTTYKSFTGTNVPLFHEAVNKDYRDIMIILKNAGADINAYNSLGNTAFFEAVVDHSLSTVKTLIDIGVDINKKTLDGKTPLEAAAEENKVDIVKLLLEKGADINIINRNGETVRQMAERGDFSEEINRLILAGEIPEVPLIRNAPDVGQVTLGADEMNTMTQDNFEEGQRIVIIGHEGHKNYYDRGLLNKWFRNTADPHAPLKDPLTNLVIGRKDRGEPEAGFTVEVGTVTLAAPATGGKRKRQRFTRRKRIARRVKKTRGKRRI